MQRKIAKALVLTLAMAVASTPVALAAWNTSAMAPLAAFVDVADVGRMQVPSNDVTWELTVIDEAPYNHVLMIMNADGTQFGAMRFHSAHAPVIALIHAAPIVNVPEVNLLDATPNANCVNPTAAHGWQVCADISSNGAGNYIWMQGSATRNTGSCGSCMTIIACSQGGFDCTNKAATFNVYATETYASACWSLPASTYYSSKVIYDGSQTWSNYVLTRSGSSTNC